jgi:DNA-binding LacI/PurR family transcriptional regulator
MVNRNDVARLAGVSSATVSRVMNGYPHITPEVRNKVMEAAQQLGYKPHQAARHLKLNRSGTIAFLAPDLSNPYFTEIFRGVQQLARERKYFTFLEETVAAPGQAQSLLERRVDGAIVFGPLPGDDWKQLYDHVPVVSLGPGSDPLASGHIRENMYEAARTVVRYLHGEGHSRIGLIVREGGGDRLRGFRDAMLEGGCTVDEHTIVKLSAAHSSYSSTQGFEAMNTLLARDTGITAVVASNDLVAIGAMAAVQEHGKRVPGDISFVGFDDCVAAKYSNPPLTTVKLLKHVKGRLAAGMLLDLIAEMPVEPIELATELIIRSSVRKLGIQQ